MNESTSYWEELSDNRSIVWSVEMLERFEHQLNWKNITQRVITYEDLEHCPILYVVKLLERFKDRWDWENISGYIDHPQVEVILDTFPGKLHWNEVADNRNIKWTDDLLQKYEDKFIGIEDIEQTEIWDYLISKRMLELTEEVLELK